jgi:predicted cobalt transporter CbtA
MKGKVIVGIVCFVLGAVVSYFGVPLIKAEIAAQQQGEAATSEDVAAAPAATPEATPEATGEAPAPEAATEEAKEQ